MDAVLTKLIEQLNSSVFILLVLLGAALVVVFKIGGWKQIFLHHSDRIKNVESIRDTVIEIQTKVDLIYRNTNRQSTIQAMSPISITKVGEEIRSSIKADEVFKNHAVRLMAMVEAKNPQNAYDIQQESFGVAKKELINLLDEKELKCVKEEAYKRGIIVEDILVIFGVLLRNKILEDKKIPIADVDKHAVKKS